MVKEEIQHWWGMIRGTAEVFFTTKERENIKNTDNLGAHLFEHNLYIISISITYVHILCIVSTFDDFVGTFFSARVRERVVLLQCVGAVGASKSFSQRKESISKRRDTKTNHGISYACLGKERS